MSLRVGVVGATGKMGRVVCAQVLEDPALELVAAVARSNAGAPFDTYVGRSTGLPVSDRREALLEARAQVAVDFTHPDAVLANARWYLEHGLHAVVGTTGLGPDDVEALRALAEKNGTNAVVAPDFSFGGAVLLHIARIAARHFPYVELLETHLPSKAEAPSGTTMNTARELAKVRPSPSPVVTSRELAPGVRGGEVAGIRVHSLRLPGPPGIEEIRLARAGELLTISLAAYDRAPFANGAVLAIKAVVSRPGLTYGLGPLLDLDGD